MMDTANFLPVRRMGRGTIRRMVEGYRREGGIPLHHLSGGPPPHPVDGEEGV
jgi:hypothetical protein